MIMIIFFIADIFIHYKTKILLENKLDIITQLCSVINVGRMLCKSRSILKDKEQQKFELAIHKLKKVKPSLGSQSNGIINEFSFLMEYLNIIFLIDIRNYEKSINEIKKNIDSLKIIYNYIGELDSALAILSYRKSLEFFCVPQITNDDGITFKGIYHPLIEEPTTNDCTIKNNIILTGANASGKSTFIKAIAINNIFASTINTCLASQYIFKPMFTITSMALHDDIVSGESYYVTEIKSLKRILDKIDETHTMCFIDEILRGTNTIERISASISVLKYIEEKNCYCIVATHDTELAQKLDKDFRTYHFDENVTDKSIVFDYKLKEGIAKSKNAIKLLSYYKYDKGIVNMANQLVEEYENKQ